VTIVPNNSNLQAQTSPGRTQEKVPFRRAGHEFIAPAGQGVSAICTEPASSCAVEFLSLEKSTEDVYGDCTTTRRASDHIGLMRLERG